MTIMARLKEATRPHHDRIEREPLAVALAAGTVTRAQVIAMHRAYLAIHEAVEHRLDRERDPRVTQIWRPEQHRVEALRADLAELGARSTPDGELDAIDRVLRLAEGAVPPLLGGLYVLEGSRLGGVFLAARIAGAIGTTLRYYTGHGAMTMQVWRAFGARMAGALAETPEAEVIAGADEVFLALEQTMAAVWRTSGDRIAAPTCDAVAAP